MRFAFKRGLAIAGAWLMLLAHAAVASAQARPFEIADNSFLVEEAFNQEPGIFQNIFNVRVNKDGDWEATFTQEWPVFSQTHQFSYTLPYAAIGGGSGLGDVMLNYRWQAAMEGGSVPAISPRLSLILPSGSAADGLGNGGPGWQVNLPVSMQFRDLYLHVNGGVTHMPSSEVDGAEYDLLTPHAAISGIWRARPMFHVMLESVVEWEDSVANGVEGRDALFTISPGFRTGWNTGDAQTIFGLAIPVEIGGGSTDVGVFGYFSYELPFLKQP